MISYLNFAARQKNLQHQTPKFKPPNRHPALQEKQTNIKLTAIFVVTSVALLALRAYLRKSETTELFYQYESVNIIKNSLLMSDTTSAQSKVLKNALLAPDNKPLNSLNNTSKLTITSTAIAQAVIAIAFISYARSVYYYLQNKLDEFRSIWYLVV